MHIASRNLDAQACRPFLRSSRVLRSWAVTTLGSFQKSENRRILRGRTGGGCGCQIGVAHYLGVVVMMMVAMGYCTDVADIISAVLMYKVAAWSGVTKPDHRLRDTCLGTTNISDRIW